MTKEQMEALASGRFTVTKTPPPLCDVVNHPAHYTAGKVECIDALEAVTEGLEGIEAVCTANAIKYLWRWKRKGGNEDLQKAKWYIDHMLQRWEKRYEK